jgi:hypothetical protein
METYEDSIPEALVTHVEYDKSASIERFIEDQAISQLEDLAPPAPPSPHLTSVSSNDDAQEDKKRDNLLTGERERGWGRRGGAKSYDSEKAWPFSNKSFNTL